jgi:NADH:ubiquinone oxidoreductase subunit E
VLPPELQLTPKYSELVREFKPNAGHLLAALHKIQHHVGYIPTEAVAAVAKQLRMTAAEVFGALTFYSEFRTAPPPKVQVNWCSGPTCRLKGGDNIRKAMESVLAVGMEENTADAVAGIHLQQCDGSCEYAPLVWLRRIGGHAEGENALLEEERGTIRGPLRVADAVELARRLKAGDVDV